MRRVSIEQIQDDDILARPIYDIDGRRLLNAGVKLTQSIIQRLVDKGVSSVYIEDELSEDVEIHGVLTDETRNQAKMTIRNEMNRLANKGEIDYGAVKKCVECIMDEMLSTRIDVLNANDIRTEDELVYAHSINVCVMAIALANKLSLPPSKIKNIAMGAIMHDIGKALIPKDLLNKKDPSPAEQNEIKSIPCWATRRSRIFRKPRPRQRSPCSCTTNRSTAGATPWGLTGITYTIRPGL